MDTQFEKILLAVLLKDQNFLDKTMGYIDEDTFSNEYYRYFFTLVERYYNKYHKVIPFEIFKYLFQNTITKQGFSDEEKPLIVDMIGDIFTLDYNIDFINKEEHMSFFAQFLYFIKGCFHTLNGSIHPGICNICIG